MGGKGSKEKNQRTSTLSQAGVTETAVRDYKKKFALTDEQIYKYLEYFVAKRDKSNRITEDSFVRSLTEMGVTKDMAKQMFRIVDADNGGTIDIQEFLMYYGIIGGGTLEQKLELSFKLFDADGNGTLSPAEIGRLFLMAEQGRMQLAANHSSNGRAARVTVSDAKVQDIKQLVRQIFDRVDENKDGQLSMEEFKTGFSKYPELCQYFLQY